MQRRHFLGRSAAAAAVAALGRPAILRAQNRQLVVAAFGGRYQDVMREAWYQPFQRATGTRVVEVSGISLARIRAMARANNMEWDAFIAVPAEMLVLAGQGLLERIDYSKLNPQLLSVVPDRVKQEFGFGGMYVSQVIGYSTRAFPPGRRHPDSWAEVWDVETFPGKRMFPQGDYSVNPIEAAVMADGAPIDQVYPLDLERAYRSLTRIRPHVLRWVNSSSAVPQALVNNEISCGLANSARLVELKEGGANLEISWSQGVCFLDYWALPKGGPNPRAAHEFIDFVSSADRQAAFAKEMPAGPIHPHAFDLLTPAQRERTPSYPENFARQLFINADWWASMHASGKPNYEVNVEMWNRWVLR